jgi:lipopolysaccharide transport system permease protein
MSEQVTYEPDNYLKKGYFSILSDIITEIRKNKDLIYQLFKRDFLTSYRQSLFGILWVFIVPIFSVATFLVLGQSNLLNIGVTPVPFVVYALLGLSFWQIFSTGIVSGSNSLVQAQSMISKINFSKKSLVIASMGKTLVAFLIQFVLALISFAIFGIWPNIAILLIPIFVIPITLATLGLSFIASILNGIMRDIGTLSTLLMTFLLFLTPVMYVAPKDGLLAIITTYNPLYYLVAVPRDLALTGVSNLWTGFIISSLFSVVVFLVCLIAFHLTETRIAERI